MIFVRALMTANTSVLKILKTEYQEKLALVILPKRTWNLPLTDLNHTDLKIYFPQVSLFEASFLQKLYLKPTLSTATGGNESTGKVYVNTFLTWITTSRRGIV